MNLNRRHLFAAAGAFAALGSTRAFAAGLVSWPMGLQLWSVAAQMQKDGPGTLKALKSLGFEVVETAGFYGGTAQTMKAQLTEAGLVCRSAHVNLGALGQDIDKHIADAKTLGASWLVASSPKTPRPTDPAKAYNVGMAEVMNEAAYQENAEIIARIVPKIRAAGLTFGYHNHAMEFAKFGARTGLDIMLAGSPDARLELDLGWVAAAGLDPAATIRKYAGRVDLLHVKDMIKAEPEYESVEIGKGVINWKPTFEAARAAGVKGFFIEQEAPYRRPILDSLAMSVAYLKAL
jgi:sugar phosphate isomerase/epimerase